jgi:putative ABC transport system permease protein
MWDQIGAVTALNLRSVPQRFGSSAVAVLGIAGVVVVFVGVLSMAQGFPASHGDRRRSAHRHCASIRCELRDREHARA